MSRSAIFSVLLLMVALYMAWADREVSRPEGILINEEPQQKAAQAKPIKYKDVVLEPLAEYSLKARVLSTESYWFDRLAPISPVDVALGWGVMSDSRVLDGLRIWQQGRFYFYSWSGEAPVTPQLMAHNSANVHLIPSTKFIENEIKRLRPGHLVHLRGDLVRVNFPDGSEALSSLVREDTGAGSCEIMWVEALDIY